MLIHVIKCFKVKNFLKIKLKENDFSFCPEITTKIGLLKLPIKEVPIRVQWKKL
jgi:dolichol-phosphate mannosyltransferase